MAVLLFLLGLSTHVTLGTHILFDYRWPEPIQHVLEIFRGSGRFVWPLYYLILILSVTTLANRLRPVFALPALILILSLQIIDLAPKFGEFHRLYTTQRNTPDLSTQTDWTRLSQHATQLIVLPRPQGDDYQPWARLALAHRLSLNAGMIARADNNALHAHDTRILNALSADNGSLPPGSLIVLTDPNIPVHPSHRILHHEGLRIIAP